MSESSLLEFSKDPKQTVAFNGEVVHWYFNNFGYYFLRPQDLIKLLDIPKEGAKAVYDNILPPELRAPYLCRELTGYFLQHLVELTGGESKKLWNKVKTEFYSDLPESKFDAPIVPFMIKGKMVPAVSLTLLHDLENVALLSGTTARIDNFAKQDHVYGALEGLLTNDSQMQFLITELCEYETMEDKTYQKIIRTARKQKLVIAKPPALANKSTAQTRAVIKNQDSDLERMRTLLMNAGIDPDSKEAQVVTLDSAIKVTAQVERDKALTAIRDLVGEQFASLYAQTHLLHAASEEVGKLWGGWDHSKFIELFDNQKILNMVAAIQKQIAKDADDRDINSIIRLCEENIGKQKQMVRQMVMVAKTKQAEQQRTSGKKTA
jgi:hypothetical protein